MTWPSNVTSDWGHCTESEAGMYIQYGTPAAGVVCEPLQFPYMYVLRPIEDRTVWDPAKTGPGYRLARTQRQLSLKLASK